MSIEANPRLNFRFAVEIAGVDQLLIQEVDMPDYEFTEITHGGLVNDPDIKTPGKPKVGDLVMRKIKPTDLPDNWVWPWLEQARVSPRPGYARVAILRELAEDGIRTLARYELGQIWPKKVAGSKYNRAGDGEKIMEEITFSVSKFKKLPETGA